MTASAHRQAPRSAIVHLAPGLPDRPGGAVRLREAPLHAQVELRLDDEAADSLSPDVGRLLRCELPRPGHATGRGDLYVLWLGPGWYLVMGRPGGGRGLLTGLEDALDTALGSAVDVSAARTVLELSGPDARTVLAHGCPLDLHPRAFGPGRCAQTVLAQAQAVLHQTAPDAYSILVRTSYADYLVRWLLDAMTEYL
ncbi:sarcosine oxidase subunit gamma [Actinomadura sp. 9N215]|uniref:sarcosine oxidase subunit gamma n=1 Tax=Actinomadura sp. 9N215 TaxID=3375150 RepID=UPI0037A41A9A